MPTNPHRICRIEELPPGERKIVDVAGRSIGVFNLDGELYALKNVCPHQLAPLCLGRISGTTLPGKVGEFNYGHEGQILRCPWHGWEFDITTGKSVFNPHKVRVKSYPVTVEATGTPAEACGAAGCAAGPAEEDPSVETYGVTVEDQWVVVHV